VSASSKHAAADLRAGDLAANVVDFAARLRRDLGFSAGQAEAREALRALEIVGVADLARVRDAFRLIFCTRRSEAERFDEAFDAFFLHPMEGVAQDRYRPRHSRALRTAREEPEHSQNETRTEARSQSAEQRTAEELEKTHGLAGSKPTGGAEEPPQPASAVSSWEVGRYSPRTGAARAPLVTASSVRALLPLADRLVAKFRMGRLRRWRPQRGGPRFDMRRTLRSSLHTGGDPVALRTLGHPLRNPRFAILIDGSRSMASHGALMLEFAYALCRRSRRTSVFVFSTDLREVTREVRKALPNVEHRLLDTGESWGGGTMIGANLERFVRAHTSRLDDQTVVIIASDGLDAGDVRELAHALRELRRRCAAIIWANPLAASPNYRPEALGMKTALPFIDEFVGVADVGGLAELVAKAGG
jgi:uncharacterized protein